MHVGLIVDMVSEVASALPEQLMPPPKNDKAATYIASVFQKDDKIILNLDCEDFFKDDLEQTRV